MIDLKAYRINPALYQEGAKNKGHTVDRTRFDSLDEQCRQLKIAVETLNAERNTLSKEIEPIRKQGGDASSQMERVKQLKQELETKEQEYAALYAEFHQMRLSIPAPAGEDVPVGKSDAENVVMEYV